MLPGGGYGLNLMFTTKRGLGCGGGPADAKIHRSVRSGHKRSGLPGPAR